MQPLREVVKQLREDLLIDLHGTGRLKPIYISESYQGQSKTHKRAKDRPKRIGFRVQWSSATRMTSTKHFKSKPYLSACQL